MKTLSTQHVQPFEFLQEIISHGGPEPHQYTHFNQVVNLLSAEIKAGNLAAVDLQVLQTAFSEDCLSATLHGHSLTKPYGYAGDFAIIDKIYRSHVTADKRYEKWDLLWHSLAATNAVRNRKDYFIKTVKPRMTSDEPLTLLNVASGPARDLFELYGQIEPAQLQTTCVEADERAIDFAKALNEQYLHQIRFNHKNVFRYYSREQFDIVWSAGLFDYFNDTIFVKLLRRLLSYTKPGGEVIIGNFNTINPSRHVMELFGDWYLEHRSEEQLIDLALQAGACREAIYVGKEAEAVNLFLHVKNG